MKNKPYRIKHIPTGLYYNHRTHSLSKTGSVLRSDSSNILLYSSIKTVLISTRAGSKIFKKTEKTIEWNVWGTYADCDIPTDQFEIEYYE